MTPAQKKNVERFKKAAAEAKKLRAKNPKLSQAQAVKQAFAILYKGGKIAAVKTAKKATVTVKKKKPIADNSHRDNRSHNVNIRVMSGVKIHSVRGLKNSISELESWQKILDKLRNEYASEKRAQYKKSIREDIQESKKWITHYKRIVQDHLKNIK
jgi:hypothetical protein